MSEEKQLAEIFKGRVKILKEFSTNISYQETQSNITYISKKEEILEIFK